MRPEFAPTAQEEAEKINAQTGIGLVTEPEFWAKQGIYTGEELALSILHQEYSDTYKALHGIRPRFKSFDTVDQVQDALDDLDREYEAMEAQAKLDAAVEADFQAEREELASLQVPGLDLDFEKKPMRSGMGRRMEGRKVKVTRRQLRRMIREEMAHPRHGLGKNVADADFPIVVGYGDRSEIAYDQDELDNILDMITGGPGSSTNIPYSLDSLEDMEPKDRPVGADIEGFAEGKVKITRSQLKRMIMESVGAEKMHRCFDGSLVPFGSNECLEDLYQRKDDAQAVRDECSIRTDKRDYYNGVLKVLRRDIRDAEKENARLNPAPKIEKL